MLLAVRYPLTHAVHVVRLSEAMLPISSDGLVRIELTVLHLVRPLLAPLVARISVTSSHLFHGQFRRLVPAGRVVRWLRNIVPARHRRARIDLVERAGSLRLSRWTALRRRHLIRHVRVVASGYLRVVKSRVAVEDVSDSLTCFRAGAEMT